MGVESIVSTKQNFGVEHVRGCQCARPSVCLFSSSSFSDAVSLPFPSSGTNEQEIADCGVDQQAVKKRLTFVAIMMRRG